MILKKIVFIDNKNFMMKLMPTTERAILPGDYIPNHTCQKQISAKLNLD